MPGAFNRRTRRRPTINITSLIDVMFLLLIFFMVSATFRQDFGVEIDLPEAVTAQRNDSDQPYAIRVTEQGQTYFGEDIVTREELRTRLQALFDEDSDATVVLEADKSAEFGRVLEVIDTAREVGGERLIIPTDLAPSAEPE